MLDFLLIAATAGQNPAAYKVGQAVGMVLGVLILIGIPILFVLCLVKLVSTKKRGWLYGLIATALPLLGFFGLMAYGAYSGFKTAIARAKTVSTATPTGIERTVDVEDSDLSVVLPGHWVELNDLNEDAELGAGNYSKEEYFIVMTESKIDFEGSLSEYSDLTAGNMIDNLQDASATDPKSVTVNGIAGIEREISGKIDHVNVIYIHTSLETETNYHQAIGWTLKSREKTAFPELRKVTESITGR